MLSPFIWLVVGPPLWKIWTSIGRMTFPIYGKIKLMFQTTNQLCYVDQATAAISDHETRKICGWVDADFRISRLTHNPQKPSPQHLTQASNGPAMAIAVHKVLYPAVYLKCRIQWGIYIYTYIHTYIHTYMLYFSPSKCPKSKHIVLTTLTSKTASPGPIWSDFIPIGATAEPRRRRACPHAVVLLLVETMSFLHQTTHR